MSERMATRVDSDWVGFVTGTDWTGYEWTCGCGELERAPERVVVERQVMVGPQSLPALVGHDGAAAVGE